MSLRDLAVQVRDLPEGEQAKVMEDKRVLSPCHIRDWIGRNLPPTMPKRLHPTGTSERMEIFMSLYLKTASFPVYQNERNPQWIPVRFKDMRIARGLWKRRKEAMGKLDEAIIMAQKAGFFKLLLFHGRLYIQPTHKGITAMTKAGEILARIPM